MKAPYREMYGLLQVRVRDCYKLNTSFQFLFEILSEMVKNKVQQFLKVRE